MKFKISLTPSQMSDLVSALAIAKHYDGDQVGAKYGVLADHIIESSEVTMEVTL